MTERLNLDSPAERSYALDSASREAGRRGLAKAREALAKARAAHYQAEHATPAAA